MAEKYQILLEKISGPGPRTHARGGLPFLWPGLDVDEVRGQT